MALSPNVVVVTPRRTDHRDPPQQRPRQPRPDRTRWSPNRRQITGRARSPGRRPGRAATARNRHEQTATRLRPRKPVTPLRLHPRRGRRADMASRGQRHLKPVTSVVATRRLDVISTR